MGQIFQGRRVRISVDGKVIYHATECSIQIDSQTQSVATKDTNGALNLPDGYSWSASTNALVAEVPSNLAATHKSANDIVAIQLAGTEVEIEFTTGVEDEFVYKGKAYVTSSSITSSVGNAVSGSFTFTGNGDLTLGVVE